MTKPSDRRMYWLRNIEALASSPTSGLAEAEIASEVRITGQLEYGDGAIIIRPITYQADAKGLLKYVLRIRHPIGMNWEGQPSTTRQGYLFPGGPLGELIALSSLRLQARLFLLSITSRSVPDDLPSSKVEYSALAGRVDHRIDSVVFNETPRSFTTEVGPFLDQVKRVPEKHHLDVAVAAGRYAHALTLIGEDEELVFVSLVSAIERLALDQVVPDDPISGRSVDELLRTELLEEAQIEELRSVLDVRKCKQRFIAFLQRYSKGFFEGENREPPHTQVTPENLQVVAGAIYDARSAYLHNGDPMYLSSPIPAAPGWHMDATVGLHWQDRYFSQRQKLPFAAFFHRLVRHCILARIDDLLEAG